MPERELIAILAATLVSGTNHEPKTAVSLAAKLLDETETHLKTKEEAKREIQVHG
jgi:hypothetical protein